MSFRIKLMLTMGTIGLLALSTILTMSFVINKNSRLDDVHADMNRNLLLLSEIINHEVEELVDFAENISLSELIVGGIRSSNLEYDSLSSDDRTLKYIELTDLWKTDDEELINSVMNNSSANVLSSSLENHHSSVEEVLVINKYGVVITSSFKMNSIIQMNSFWWGQSVSDNAGYRFIDVSGYNQAAAEYYISISIPINDSGGELVGFVQLSTLISNAFDGNIDRMNNDLNNGEYILFGHEGLVISKDGNQNPDLTIDERILELYDGSTQIHNTVELDDEDYIIGVAPIGINLHKHTNETDSVIDDHNESMDAEWSLLFIISESDAFTSLNNSYRIFGRMAAGIIIVVMTLSYFAGSRLSKPINELSQFAIEVSKGDFSIRAKNKYSSETGRLFIELNNLVENLENTTTSKDRLLDEIVQKNRLEELLLKLARNDELTKVYNRRAFIEFFDKYISKSEREKKQISVLLIDIDDFKNVNDSYGHNIGDEILINLSNNAKKTLRDSDIFARWGGEEFVIMLPDTTKSDAILAANRVRKAIKEFEHPIAGIVTVSIGVTLSLASDGRQLNKMVSRADKALYKAKNSGKDRVEFL